MTGRPGRADSGGGNRAEEASRAKRSLLLDRIIRWSQYTPLGNSKRSFTTLKETFVEEGPRKTTESDHEARHLDDFLGHFAKGMVDDLRGLRILDFGCGYGGKAVELARRLPDSEVVGIEPHQWKIDKADDFAARVGVRNATFKLCTPETIPLADESVDAVVSHDVIEHVENPDVVLRELHRVLKPGGRAYLVFPPYDGALSHHLDFVTMFPGLHWFFSADTIMATVNHILASDYGKRFKCPPQPPAAYSVYADKRVLPSLNGLGSDSFRKLAAPLFQIRELRRVTVLDKLSRFGVPPRVARRAGSGALAILPFASERLTLSLAVILEKPSPGQRGGGNR